MGKGSKMVLASRYSHKSILSRRAPTFTLGHFYWRVVAVPGVQGPRDGERETTHAIRRQQLYSKDHSITAPSSPTDTMRLPSGENFTLLMVLLWPTPTATTEP